ncbi:MAG TPA: hypothetical protein ENI87_10545 [bacterium]|nr:hypothetical protein [bacterium]
MKISASILAASLIATAAAQSQLDVNPQGGGFTYGQPGANFVDLTVLNPNGITLQALEFQNQSTAGTIGTIEVWITDGSTVQTHVGNETNQAVWTKISEGTYEVTAFGGNATTCQSAYLVNVPNTVLAPGTYGFAIVYTDITHVFTGVTTYPQTFANADASITNGTTQATAWTSNPLNAFTFNGTNYTGVIPDFTLFYAPGAIAHECAECSASGIGSNVHSASTYQLFGEPNAAADASAALQGNSMTFIPNANFDGYELTTGIATWYTPNTTGAATALAQADDAETQILTTLPVQYCTPTGLATTNDVFIHTNGYVSLALTQSAIGFAPVDPATNMNADATAFFSHHDFNNTEAGSGDILWEEDLTAGLLVVTWDGVESYPANTANPSSIQFQFDLVTGMVHVLWDTIDPTGGSTFFGGDNTLIGWSPAGASPLPDPLDISTISSTNTLTLQMPEVFPLTLDTVGAPLIGQSFDLVTSNDPAPGVGVNLLGTAAALLPLPLPLDTPPFGAPTGTVLYLDPALSFLNTIGNVPGSTLTLTIPIVNNPTLAGFKLYSQSFWLDFTGANFPFTNLVTSNLVDCTVGNF